jgi:succinate dehydrogenase / fumarate reductase cytochrome b subunit
MTPPFRALSSSIGTKIVIALTGLLLVVYLILHLAGNVLVFAGRDLFNEYSHALLSNPLLPAVEIGLALVIVIHAYRTVRMWLDNQRARPARYAVKKRAGHTSRKSLASSTMILSGLVTLLFIVIHVNAFRIAPKALVPGTEIADLYTHEMRIFANPLTVAFYVLSSMLVGLHLRHGVASALQSLGIEHPRYTKRMLLAGTVLAVVLAAGFAVIPIWAYLAGG